MRSRFRLAASVVISAGLLGGLLGGCQTSEQNGALAGAGVGAVACGVAGALIFHTALGATASAGACGAAGYFIGSAIGRRLDEQERQRAAYATQQALAQPVAVPRGRTTPITPPARPVRWTSDSQPNVRGTAAVVSVQPEASGGECRVVRETAYIKGEEVNQNSRYCRNGGGEWMAQT